ncbi:MAG: hypothetical protein LBQ66_01910 [Planctomycetaceae bacterium]|jgi:hypothetical protein|nr:hypothetical protein [Planctomycetaceae bacterium]
MKSLDRKTVLKYIEEHIDEFHKKRETKLYELDFREVIRHKNPYLFKAKNILTAQDLVNGFLTAHLHTQEETIFGHFLEELVIFVCGQVFGGKRTDPSLRGFDLEFERDNILYVVEIKSSWNWGNSSQLKQIQINSKNVTESLAQNRKGISEIIAVNGCCFGKRKTAKKSKGYLKLCGQCFWELISGDENLYIDIIEPIGHKAKDHSISFQNTYARVLNKFTLEFAKEFCDDGIINWERIVKYVSEKENNIERESRMKSC